MLTMGEVDVQKSSFDSQHQSNKDEHHGGMAFERKPEPTVAPIIIEQPFQNYATKASNRDSKGPFEDTSAFASGAGVRVSLVNETKIGQKLAAKEPVVASNGSSNKSLDSILPGGEPTTMLEGYGYPKQEAKR